MSTAVAVGAKAPGFVLPDQHGTLVDLSSFRGVANVLLVFYPFAFSEICGSELRAINDELSAFQNDTVRVHAVSTDPMFSLRAYSDAESFGLPLLSDFWPHGAVARSYGVFHEERGCAVRGTFLVDTDGVVRWTVVNGLGEPRDTAAYRQALAALV